MNEIKAFVGHSFNSADKTVVDTFLEYFDQLTGIVPHFSWAHATAAEPKELAEKVLAIMEGRNTFIGICTQNESAVSSASLKSTLWGNDHRKVAISDLQAKTSDWIIQEIGLAKGRGMELILLVEKGLRAPGGLQGNIEYIEFERDHPQLAFGKVVEMIKALSPKVPSPPVASDRSAAKEEDRLGSSEDLTPKPEWKLEEYKRSVIYAHWRNEESALKKIDLAFRASPLNDGAEVQAEWDGDLEYWKVIFGKGGNLAKLKDLTQRYPNSPDLRITLARALSHYNQYEEAGKIFIQAAELPLGAEKADIYRDLSAVEFAKGERIDAAYQQINLIKRSDVGNTTHELNLLTSLREIADIQKANYLLIAVMERIVDISPDDFETRFKLAFKHSEMGNEDLALYHYNRIPFESRAPHVWNNLGVALDNLKMPAKAVSAYRIAENGGETLAMSNLGQKLFRAGFIPEAQAIFDKARGLADYHKNIDTGLAQMKDQPEEEDEKFNELLEKLRPKAEFYRALGESVTLPSNVHLAEKWQRGERVLSIQIAGNSFTAKSTYEVSGGLANALSGLLGAGATPDMYEENYEGTINGRLIEATVKREKIGGGTSSSSLLGLNGDGKTKVLMWIAADNKSIHVAENPYYTNPSIYVLKAIS